MPFVRTFLKPTISALERFFLLHHTRLEMRGIKLLDRVLCQKWKKGAARHLTVRTGTDKPAISHTMATDLDFSSSLSVAHQFTRVDLVNGDNREAVNDAKARASRE